jgi:hypothetical protein
MATSLRIYVTAFDGVDGPPTLFIPDGGIELPLHPEGRRWRLLRIITDQDRPFIGFGLVGAMAIKIHGYFLTFSAEAAAILA